MGGLNARLDRLVFCILARKVGIHLSILNIQFRSRPYPLTLQGGLAPLTLACFRDNIELVRTSMHSAHFQQTILFFLLEPSFWIPFLSVELVVLLLLLLPYYSQSYSYRMILEPPFSLALHFLAPLLIPQSQVASQFSKR